MSTILRWVRAHRSMSAVLFTAAGAGMAFLFYWFAPWKLFVDEAVQEALPVARAEAAPKVLASGAFRALEHATSGTAKILEAGGTRTLRLEDLATSNGPQLVVILSPTPATDDSWTAYGEGDIVELGPLKGNLGSQNYEIPAGVDLSRYRSAVVWCKRFSVAFGAAPIDG
jgi:hypothetical protein